MTTQFNARSKQGKVTITVTDKGIQLATKRPLKGTDTVFLKLGSIDFVTVNSKRFGTDSLSITAGVNTIILDTNDAEAISVAVNEVLNG